MKRLIPLLLLLLLCGCTAQPPKETTTLPPEPTSAPAEATEPVGIYEPFSDLEIQTNGAVRYYLPDTPDAYGLRTVGEDVLVFSGTQTTTLTRYTGEKLYTIAQAELDCRIEPEDASFQISENGITYYNPRTNELVFLDKDLKEVRRLELSVELVGKPVLSSDRSLVYYCTADAVRVFDTSAGLDKLLKSIAYPHQSLEGVLLNDTVLRCDLTDDRGGEAVLFLSAQTGELLYEIPYALNLTTGNGFYYAKAADGILNQVFFGRQDQALQVLTPGDPFGEIWVLEQTHSAVTATMTEEGAWLEHYDLATGLRKASVKLPAGILPGYMEPQVSTGKVWLMAHDQVVDSMVICLWDCAATAVQDETVYIGQRYTAENPDEAGLAECAALAQEIGQTHGVRILVGQDAVAEEPWDYALELEYQTVVIRRELEKLKQALDQFPDGFFEKLHGQTNICIVRSITGSAESGSVASARGIQFWSGEKAYVVLAVGDGLEQSFYHEIFHVLDSKILSTTRVYYHWENLNPEGCKYFEDYTSYLTADAEPYLQDETRVFIDAYSMSYPKEDRARIMEYACMAGNEHYFQSEVMQQKLERLCEGIRKAFQLEQYPEAFLWEQYLAESLD